MSAGNLRPITEVASDLGVAAEHLIPYGSDKAKIRLEARDASGRPPGKLVLVSAITPTRAGEGKTTTSIGLAQGLAKIGRKVCLALREPSLGPTFGIKGGATGGGKSIVVPVEEINLHFTGDFHAITSANNILAAIADNHLHFRKEPLLDQRQILWRRVLDLNDRALRNIVCGLGGRLQGIPREDGFDITAASEIMAVLCLADDADDLRARLERLLVGYTPTGEPVRAKDIPGAVGSMMVLLKDAIQPNLVQTGEGVPALIHGGPFANIAHGCNSVIATRMALAHSDWVITEAGFGADLGAEKFLDIKCQSAGLEPAAVVLVATIRALKLHGGVGYDDLTEPNPAAVERGLVNLSKHIENIRSFGQTPLVALNRFGTDSDAEVEVVRGHCVTENAPFAVSDIYARGGDGGIDFAEALVAHVEGGTDPIRPLYEWSEPIKEKVGKIATTLYGADGVIYTKQAEKDLAQIETLGYGDLPVCMAKTPASLSDDPSKLGRPSGFEVTVRGFVVSAGAGFVVALLGDILRMPGLARSPAAERIDLVDGKIVGLMAG